MKKRIIYCSLLSLATFYFLCLFSLKVAANTAITQLKAGTKINIPILTLKKSSNIKDTNSCLGINDWYFVVNKNKEYSGDASLFQYDNGCFEVLNLSNGKYRYIYFTKGSASGVIIDDFVPKEYSSCFQLVNSRYVVYLTSSKDYMYIDLKTGTTRSLVKNAGDSSKPCIIDFNVKYYQNKDCIVFGYDFEYDKNWSESYIGANLSTGQVKKLCSGYINIKPLFVYRNELYYEQWSGKDLKSVILKIPFWNMNIVKPSIICENTNYYDDLSKLNQIFCSKYYLLIKEYSFTIIDLDSGHLKFSYNDDGGVSVCLDGKSNNLYYSYFDNNLNIMCYDIKANKNMKIISIPNPSTDDTLNFDGISMKDEGFFIQYSRARGMAGDSFYDYYVKRGDTKAKLLYSGN